MLPDTSKVAVVSGSGYQLAHVGGTVLWSQELLKVVGVGGGRNLEGGETHGDGAVLIGVSAQPVVHLDPGVGHLDVQSGYRGRRPACTRSCERCSPASR